MSNSTSMSSVKASASSFSWEGFLKILWIGLFPQTLLARTMHSSMARSGKSCHRRKLCTSFLTDKDNFPARLNSLEVCVSATRMTILPGSDFLVPAEKREYGRIAREREGGCRSASGAVYISTVENNLSRSIHVIRGARIFLRMYRRGDTRIPVSRLPGKQMGKSTEVK